MMRTVNFTPRITCIFSHSNPYGWPIHPSDVRKEAFISYWGWNSKSAAEKFVRHLHGAFPGCTVTAQLRPSKRLPEYKYELKIWGLPWSFVRNEVAQDADELIKTA